MKAPGQIGGGINRGIEPAAQRAAEAEGTLSCLLRNAQDFLYHRPDGYVISQSKQLLIGKSSLFHRSKAQDRVRVDQA